jgi:threonine aldolase
MAARLARGLEKVSGAKLLQPVQANELFIAVPERLIAALESEGFHFYRWPWLKVRDGAAIRLVTSYATSPADVDDFVQAATRASV